MDFKTIWGTIREKFPPARAVAFLTPFVLPAIAYVNVWIADHAPWVDQYVNADERKGIVLATLLSGIVLAYKWLDGRAKWETAQVEGQVALAQAGISPAAVGAIEAADPHADLDEDAYFSAPGEEDIAESDVEDPDELAKRERVELEEPQ